MSPAAAAIVAAGPTCTCHAFPAVHRADLHDAHGQVVDIEMAPNESWAALQHAKCKRCGWRSQEAWFADDFARPSAQTRIAEHRDRWTDTCTATA